MHRRLKALLASVAGFSLATAGMVAHVQPAAAEPPPREAAEPPPQEEFQQITLAKGPDETGEPMTLGVLPDTSVLHTSRDGRVFHTDPTGATKVAAEIPVYDHDEEGMQGIGIDPDFAENRFVYLYYAPELDTPPGEAPSNGTAEDFAPFEGHNVLSRFVLDEDNTLDLASEVEILEVEADRGQCCHAGGAIDFDADGNLYLSTGDDTNPFASDGYTPIDERPDRNPVFDAQRASANTNDLRGKILRITVQEDGSYTVPEGNLYEPGTEGTREEIYAMGFRNPFRMSVDQETGIVYVGDYGPDAGAADPGRGPASLVEFHRVTGPGNFGWPYCIGDNEPFVEYDFATGESGEPFDCAAPVNESPNNTGLTELPPAEPGWITYDRTGELVPEFGTGSESPMAGPVYRHDPSIDSDNQFPESMDGAFFAAEYGRGWIKTIEQGEDGEVAGIHDFLWEGTQPMDLTFGPDGALYVLDYGTGWYAGDENSALYRIDYTQGVPSPIAEATADQTNGPTPLEVTFSAEGSHDPDGGDLEYAWDFGDGTTSDEAEPSHTYTEPGQYSAQLTVTNEAGKTGSSSVLVTAGNTAPEVELVLPADGQLADFGEEVPFEVRVTDPEDEEIDCSRVRVTFILGHDTHGHPQTSTTGCEGTLTTQSDDSHDAHANIFGVWDAEYTDTGGEGDAPPLTGSDQSITQTTTRQAQHFGEGEGVDIVDREAAHGGKAVAPAEDAADGSWIAFEPYVLADAEAFTAEVASGDGGVLEVRAEAPDGPLLGTVDVPATGSGSEFTDVTTELSGQPEGTTTLHLVFAEGQFALDAFTFTTADGDGGGGEHDDGEHGEHGHDGEHDSDHHSVRSNGQEEQQR